MRFLNDAVVSECGRPKPATQATGDQAGYVILYNNQAIKHKFHSRMR